jgi:TRAP-type C4-dicarboxylate transport system permease small subunit
MPNPFAKPGHIASGLKYFNRRIDLLVEATTSILLVAIVGINSAEIFTRLFFSDSLTWVFEMNLLLANWLYFMGICLVYFRRKDIVIEFFFDKMPKSAQRLAMVGIQLLVISTFAVLAWFSVPLIQMQSETTSPGLNLPNHLFSFPILISSVVMIFYVVADLIGAEFDPSTEGKSL